MPPVPTSPRRSKGAGLPPAPATSTSSLEQELHRKQQEPFRAFPCKLAFAGGKQQQQPRLPRHRPGCQEVAAAAPTMELHHRSDSVPRGTDSSIPNSPCSDPASPGLLRNPAGPLLPHLLLLLAPIVGNVLASSG